MDGALMRYVATMAGMAALAGIVACTETGRPSEGKALYDSYCVACHGPGGRGDGPLAADLPVAPVDLTLLSQANDGVFPYSEVMAQIYGYPGRYAVMPEFGPLLSGPSVIWKDEEGVEVRTPKALLSLAQYLETIQQ